MSIFVSLLILFGGSIAVPNDTSTGGPGRAVAASAIVAPSTAPVADDTSAGGPGTK
ncbi:MAG: hypothetical protein JWM87_4273 [Candidatus Eremiobacteraeota bacterium]|nr:hypothetical protein [Candidatus Eremiobacteraeota bacterium]